MAFEQKRIGIFDSGIGGFSIWKELISELAGHQFFYISDVPNSPYGNKTSSFIRERSEVLANELLKENVDIILLACNTATAEAIDGLRNKFEVPFVGIEPFVRSIENIDLTESNFRPVVLTTRAMHESQRFKDLLLKYDKNNILTAHACDHLASLIEEGYKSGIKSVETKIEEELSPLKNSNFTHAILGCTHYPLISDKIKSYLNVECVSPCLPVSKRVAYILKSGPIDSRTELYFKTSNQENFETFDPALLSLK